MPNILIISAWVDIIKMLESIFVRLQHIMGVARRLVGRPDFKSGGGLTKSMVGSIPIYSRHTIFAPPEIIGRGAF